MLAIIQLENYYVTKIDFKYNPHSEDSEEHNVRFGHNFKYLEENGNNKVEVKIKCDVSDKDSGMELSVTLLGIFKVNGENSENEIDHKTKEVCERNTLAILFPYLRSTISDISLKANIQPVILPTINIIGLLDKAKEESAKEIKD